jgi:uncharacterized protein YaaN involved in tellurite resistance
MKRKDGQIALKTNGHVEDAYLVSDIPAAENIPVLSKATPEEAQEIQKRVAEIDMSDTRSIVSFGSRAQTELQQISQSMLDGVRNKDVGPAGAALRDMVVTIKGFDIKNLNRKPSFLDRLLGRAKPLVQWQEKYKGVQTQIDRITQELLRHEHALMKDIESLDMLYDKTLGFYNSLAIYISAGEEKLRQLDEIEIPEMERRIDEVAENDKVMAAQSLRDFRAARDDLERRVHDLKLTRQVTMQSLPSIRLVQENDKSLVTKINSTLTNTIPLWETQLAQAVTINRSAEAAKSVRDANDLTNDLLASNASNLRQANRMVREEVERGTFDIEAIKKANEDLISTIDESLQIADMGKERRARAEQELQKLEGDLKSALSSAKSRSRDRNPVDVT